MKNDIENKTVEIESEEHKDVGTGVHTISIIAGKITALLATFGIQLFLTRYLTKYEYGMFSQYFTIVLFASTIFSLGIPSNLYYFYPNETIENRRMYVSHTYILLVIFAIISGLVLFIPGVNKLITGGGDITNYKYLIIVGVVLTIPTFIIDTLYVVNKDVKTCILFPPIREVQKAIFIIAFGLLISGVNAVIYSFLLATFFPSLFSLIYTYAEVKTKDKKVPLIDIRLMNEQLKYALPFGFAVIVNTVIQRIDKIVSISYLSVSDYASYSVAFLGVPGIQQVYDSLAQVMILKIVNSYKSGDNLAILNSYKQFVSKALSFTIPIIIIVCLYAKKIILFLFTEKYIDAVPLFQLYLLSFIIGSFGCGIILRATGKTGLTLKAYLYSAIFVIPATYYFIRLYGVWGGMSSALMGLLLPRVFLMYIELKEFNYKLADYIPWAHLKKIMLISLGSVIPLALIEHFYTYNIVVAMLLSFIYVVFVFAVELRYDMFIISQEDVMSKTANNGVINKIVRYLVCLQS